MKKIIPDLRGKELDEAKEILTKEGIKYEDKTKEVLSFIKKGKVANTKPKKNTEIDTNNKVLIQVSQGPFFLILAAIVIIVGALSFSLSTGAFRSIIGQTIITGTKAPKVDISKYKDENGNPIWKKDVIIEIENPGENNYEYCIRNAKEDDCQWQTTNTNNIVVAENGKNYVTIREVDKDGNKGPTVDLEVYIDNNNPNVIKVDTEKTTDGIKVTVAASDDESGVEDYYYSTDGKNWTNDDKTHTFTDTDIDKIYIKVVDVVGNETVVVVDLNKEDNKPIESTNPSQPSINWDIPQINLSKVPTIFTYGDKYELPTYIDFGNDTGTYSCLVDNKVETTTEKITVGPHFIACTAISNHGKQTMVEKNITVDAIKGEDEIIDGWIRLNLNYPSESINRQWRLNRTSTIRTYNDGWRDYTGPILVKLSDIENVYIRYDLEGETYIIAPNGEIAVSIEPENWILKEGTTKVKIYYDKTATLRQYRINDGQWTNYTGEFEVEVGTKIDARVEKEERLYDTNGDYIGTKVHSNRDTAYIARYTDTDLDLDDPSYQGGILELPQMGTIIINTPSMASDMELDGPIITSNPASGIVESTEVTIATAEPGTIYYKEGNGVYKKYTGSFVVKQNEVITAYYYRDSDGMKSRTSIYLISNIKVGHVPYVGIHTNPTNYLTENIDKVTVSITADNYDLGTLVYSTDGIIYKEYTGPFVVRESTTVYAKATNSCGEGKDKLTITTSTTPTQLDKLDVFINVNPSREEVQGLINNAEVSIVYDGRATKKYYSLDGNNWLEYTGPFEITSNTTVYGYATSDTGRGLAMMAVDYLTTGIIKPIIRPDTYNQAYQVKVSIEYDRNSIVKKYRIDNGEWIDYTGEFYVYDNCAIYAYNENALGYKAQSSREIDNIIPRQNLIVLDEGKYYLIRLNYPTTSQKENREYKYKENGVWKKYNERGIYLIKSEYKDDIINSGNDVAIKDNKGNIVILTDHYYFLDQAISDAVIDIYMRWEEAIIAKPRISLNTQEPVQKVKVNIQYANEIVGKEYKLIYSDGTTTEWLPYTGQFEIDKNDTYIYARGIDIDNAFSDVASLKITNIDKANPTIEVRGDFTTNRYSLNLTVSAHDNMMIERVKYAKGSHNVSYFRALEDTIPNNSIVKVEENGVYSFYVIDQAGNETVKEIEITNIDKEMPNISIDILTKKLSSIVKLKINYGDSVTKQYKIGKNTSVYTNYSTDDEIVLTSYDHYQLANPDGSITVCARGVKTNNVEGIVCEDIYVLDTEMISMPVINSNVTYPLLTSNGFNGEGLLTVTFADRNDLVNEICLVGCDNQDNWSRYSGPINYTVGTVKARSKKESGLTVENTKEINYKDDSITYNVIDNDTATFMQVDANTTKMFEVNTRDTLKIRIQSDAQGSATVKTYKDNRLTSTTAIDSTTQDVMILPGTNKVEITTGESPLILYEMVLIGRETSYTGDSILSILQDNDLTSGYYYFIANDTLYTVHLYEYEGNQVWDNDTIPEPNGFGNAGDVATASSYAQNMVIVKVNGDLTNDTTIKPYSTEYGGPKGFLLYVTGKLTNNGTIDNSHGAYAEGQDVYLWKNADGTYEYVPAVGANGAQGARNAGKLAGSDGTGRQTGGGGAGDTYLSTNGNGGKGTSYSGGSGSGQVLWEATGNSASDFGGIGGNGYNGKSISAVGGTGNPGGQGGNNSQGTSGTGGLLIIYANEYMNNGTLSANGTKASTNAGSSGAGSINIFTNQSPEVTSLGLVVDVKYTSMLGSIQVLGGGTDDTQTGHGGNGTVNIGGIRNGQYYDLKQIIQQDIDLFVESITLRGDSILSIVDNIELPEGEYYYYFVVNNEEYPVHLYVYDGDQNWDGKVIGAAADCASGLTSDKMAQNMVIAKVKGNLTNTGTIRPYYDTTYGGPKGFLLYVTGKLTNNGTIDNSHGAYAEGQDVYLWKNADGTYEYVPAVGADGAQGARNAGKLAGSDGTGRQTGGGGAGDTYLSTNGNGGKGTSYSGGSGSGQVLWEATGNSASDFGGIGGNGYNGKNISGVGGTGNPGGQGGNNSQGTSGTGGLLIIYSNEFENSAGTLSANGTKASTNAGSSGAGSINIFTNLYPDITSSGTPVDSTYSALLGGTSVLGGGTDDKQTGPGGNGTVSIGGIRNGQYYDLKQIIQQDIDAFIERENIQNDISLYLDSPVIEGDSILSILNENDFTNGYYNFKANGKNYLVHLYNYDGNQNWYGIKVFGEAVDCAKGTGIDDMAQAMVIVKVNGNLTNNGEIRPYYHAQYGGPKGFLLYVTGTLTNNGTIDNSHGAYAQGEDVYLWDDATIPAIGADGGAGGAATGGKKGTDGVGRQTGGGGGGAGEYGKKGGNGKSGTSYSGGSAGGGGNYSTHGTDALDYGSAGGNGGHQGGGGAGNPGGAKGIANGKQTDGGNGTGGLLIIYANSYNNTNNGKVTAVGTSGGVSGYASGGGSGGGSINIFYQTLISEGITQKDGGAQANASYKGGAGGNGTVTYTQITMPTRGRSSSPKRAIAYIAPLMEIDTLDLVTTKLLTITYQDGYRGEYSLDLGETWLEYKEGIYVEENTTILARTVDSEGNIVRTSSFTITTIKKEDVITTPPLNNNNTGKDETDDESGNEVINPDGGDDDE